MGGYYKNLMAVGYDKKSMQHSQLVLSLPLAEGFGARLVDIAKPHHYSSGNMTWSSLLSGLPVATFDGATQYADIAAADSADLDIIAQNYSIVGWVYYRSTLTSQVVIARYGLDVDGWELYLNEGSQSLSLRHHHASLAPDMRDSCFSAGWLLDNWYLFGISRDDLYPRHYRNGEEVVVTYDAGGLKDPDTCARDLVIGCRFTKNMNWLSGYMHGLRVWVGKALTAEEHRHIFNTERRWFL
jgi:hypothetical protein